MSVGRPATADPPDPASGLLARLAAGAGPVPAGDVAAVVAHPDDETIGLGGQMARLPGLTLVHVTDGAPRGGAAAEHGFADPAAYAAARRRELETAVGLAGIGPDALLAFGVPDQAVCLHLADIARRLADLLAARGIRTVLTHAYEGGHPDHDGTAFAVHHAARLLGRRGADLEVLEMPFYHLAGDGRAEDDGPGPAGGGLHLEDDGWEVGRFAPGPGGPGLALALDPAQRARKQRMLAAHRSQAGVLARFGSGQERFRAAPAHDFAALPNSGRLLYERHGWGMSGDRFLALAAQAARELGTGR